MVITNTRRAAARRAEKDMDNKGASDNQVTPLEEFSMGYHVSVVPPQMIDRRYG